LTGVRSRGDEGGEDDMGRPWINLVLALWIGASAVTFADTESFQLRSGVTVTGVVLRQSGSELTIKHDTGVATYRFDELDPATRDRYFSRLEQLAAREKAESRSRVVDARTGPWRDLTSFQRVQRGCFLAGSAAVLIAEVWFIAAAFSTSPAWGILVFLFGGLRSVSAGILFLLVFLTFAGLAFDAMPPEVLWFFGLMLFCMTGVGLLFIIRHWKKACGPLIAELIGVGLLVVAAIMEAVWSRV
jgi:hypothetical protein